jgi:hypothetical protein
MGGAIEEPMLRLETPRQDAFAQNVVKGMALVEA